MKDLTSRQKEILQLIKDYLNEKGFPPTRADISRNLGFKSPNAAEQHLRAIEKKGFISILSGASRGIVLNKEESGIPVVGLVAADASASASTRTVTKCQCKWSRGRRGGEELGRCDETSRCCNRA